MRAVVIRARTSLVRREAEVASPPALPAALTQSLLSTSDVSSVDRLELAAPPGSRVSWAALAEQVATVQRDADVTHALDLVAGAAALSARRVTGVPVVVRAQLCGAGTGPSGRTAVRAAVLRAADTVLVPTETDRELARALGADPQRVRLCTDAALVTHTECGGRGPPRGRAAAAARRTGTARVRTPTSTAATCWACRVFLSRGPPRRGCCGRWSATRSCTWCSWV